MSWSIAAFSLIIVRIRQLILRFYQLLLLEFSSRFQFYGSLLKWNLNEKNRMWIVYEVRRVKRQISTLWTEQK